MVRNKKMGPEGNGQKNISPRSYDILTDSDTEQGLTTT
jgi:hypothetical protein